MHTLCMGSPFPVVYAKWSLVFRSVNNSYWPKTVLSPVLILTFIWYWMLLLFTYYTLMCMCRCIINTALSVNIQLHNTTQRYDHSRYCLHRVGPSNCNLRMFVHYVVDIEMSPSFVAVNSRIPDRCRISWSFIWDEINLCDEMHFLYDLSHEIISDEAHGTQSKAVQPELWVVCV